MQITLQNSSKYAKGFGAQDSGQLPLYMGPISSIDLTPSQFLTYFDQFRKATLCTRPVDGMARLLVTPPEGQPGAVSADDLLAGMIAGHLGPDAQALATAWDKSRKDQAEAEAKAVRDRRAQMIQDLSA